jgi:hypothetical protein
MFTTYAEVLLLPRSTRVRLLDGRVGYIVGWHHSSESVSLRYDGEGTMSLRAANLHIAADGSVEEAEPDGVEAACEPGVARVTAPVL